MGHLGLDRNNEILIIGGTGSLGKTILKELLTNYSQDLKGIRIFSRDELKQWELQNKLKEINPHNIPVSFLIGDIRDYNRVKRAMEGVDIVYHTAAMKQVPACEYNPFEAVRTNVTGAENIINAAIDCNVKRVMNVSTDKAVYPVNIYGVSKAMAEKMFIHGNVYSSGHKRTKFSCCRYGNVFGSRGSIIPLFLEQIEKGKITITSDKMTRFWIRLEDVAKFIIERTVEMQGGEIFIPEMPSMHISHIAKYMIEYEGKEIPIEEIGIRKGEKLHECLITFEESKYMEKNEGYFTLYPLEEEKFNTNKHTVWAYYSDTNTKWLNRKKFEEYLNEYKSKA